MFVSRIKIFSICIGFVFCVTILRCHDAKALDPFEIQVYASDIEKPKDVALEIHLNHTFINRQPLQFSKQLSLDHITHLTFEFAYGLRPWLELGGYLQFAASEKFDPYWGGAKLRAKFVVPKFVSKTWHFGVNTELSYIPSAFDNSPWGGEIRPIIGWNSRRLMVLFNPIIEVNFQNNAGLSWSPAVKAAADLWRGYALGAEYYAGTLASQQSWDLRLREQYAFATFDLWGRDIEFNVGIGAGLTPQSQRLVAKTIIGFPL